jgi:hypothetical protein
MGVCLGNTIGSMCEHQQHTLGALMGTALSISSTFQEIYWSYV